MITALLFFVLFFGCVGLLFLSDSMQVSHYDKIHERIKSGEKFTYNELIKILGYPNSKEQTKNGLRCGFVAHSTANPVRILVVYFDEKNNYIKHNYSIGFNDVD